MTGAETTRRVSSSIRMHDPPHGTPPHLLAVRRSESRRDPPISRRDRVQKGPPLVPKTLSGGPFIFVICTAQEQPPRVVRPLRSRHDD
ncbi:hypothetical protein MIPYR_20282 [uncultured Microbacterium sp.]|uniref:Uncharacterized protein n=1 Tax=uncultured Microbacterium sp. TaxID=191216 RepID=A0A1Y5P705_9MICO|nr:hypothetical protein MIPYR_20282 [uncultured Microbacterium sp.]